MAKTRPIKDATNQTAIRNAIRSNARALVANDLKLILDKTDNHEDRVEILLIEILRELQTR